MNIAMGSAYGANPYITQARSPATVTSSSSPPNTPSPETTERAATERAAQGAPPSGGPPPGEGAPSGPPPNGPPPSQSGQTGSDSLSLFEALVAEDTEEDSTTSSAASAANALYSEMQNLIMSNAV